MLKRLVFLYYFIEKSNQIEPNAINSHKNSIFLAINARIFANNNYICAQSKEIYKIFLSNMKHIGYINNAQDNEPTELLKSLMRQYHCCAIYVEQDDIKRSAWKSFVDNLDEGDVAVLLSFDNAFFSFSEMIFFLKLCTKRKVRIISISDAVDSFDELFPEESSTRSTLSAIVSMSASKTNKNYNDIDAELVSDKRCDRKLKRYRMVINMYNAGYSIKDIMNKTGYKGKSTIYKILHLYDVEMEYPTMSRNPVKDGTNQYVTPINL